MDSDAKLSAGGDYFLPDLCQGRAVFILVLVTELFVLTMVLAASGIRAFAWEYLALASMFVQWVVLSSACLLCALRHRLAQLSLVCSVIAVYGLVLTVILIFTVMSDWVLAGADLNSFKFDINGYAVLRNQIVGAVMVGIVLRYLYVQAQLRKQEQAELQARIAALQSRINPHFLFNSMNSIASLIGSEPETAERVVEDLCELFRASLRQTAKPVAFIEELDLCRRYLAIEQLRLGERLQVEWQIDTLPEGVTLPLLSLQPILENAVYHGVQPLLEGGTIAVLIRYQAGFVEISVTNPSHKTVSTLTHASGNKMALDNIRLRLNALYGERASLQHCGDDNVYVTQLRFPVLEEQNCA